MKKIIISVFMLILAFNLNAQKVGVMGGLNLASVSTDASGDLSLLPGGNASVFFQKTLIPMISLRPGIGITQKGYTGQILGIDYKENLNYFQLDLNLRVKPPIIPVYVIAGPYFDYGLSGKTTFGSGTTITSDVIFDKNHVNPFDFGITLGAGFVKNLVLGKVFIEARYEIGMLDTDNSSSYSYYKNRNIMINFGFMLGL